MTAAPPGGVLDDSAAPLVLARFPAQPTIERYEELMGLWLDVAVRHGRIALVVDYRDHDASSVSPTFLAQSAQAFLKVRGRLASHMVGQARVFDLVATRELLVAYQWLAGSPWPLRNFHDVDEAVAWARSLF
jgi:hypothetical protein